MSHLSPILSDQERQAIKLTPKMRIKAAEGKERSDAGPWSISSGNGEYEILAFSDGGNKHAPETIELLRSYFHPSAPEMQAPAKLIYAHRGQKCESMMPLLPSLMHAIDYRGPCCSLRIPEDAHADEAHQKIEQFVSGQLPDEGFAILVVDRQNRIAPLGHLTPETVEISFPEANSTRFAP